jgi:hypothetical protein
MAVAAPMVIPHDDEMTDFSIVLGIPVISTLGPKYVVWFFSTCLFLTQTLQRNLSSSSPQDHQQLNMSLTTYSTGYTTTTEEYIAVCSLPNYGSFRTGPDGPLCFL